MARCQREVVEGLICRRSPSGSSCLARKSPPPFHQRPHHSRAAGRLTADMNIAALRRWYRILEQLKAAQLEVARRKQYATGRGLR